MSDYLRKDNMEYLLKLYSETSSSRSSIHNHVKLTDDYINNSFLPSLKNKVLESLKKLNDETILQEVDEIFKSNQNVFKEFSSESKTLTIFERESFYIKPEVFQIGEETYFVIVNHTEIQVKKRPLFGVHVSLPATLRAFLEREGMFSEIMTYIKSLVEEKIVISNIIQAELWKQKYETSDGIITLPLLIYYDDFENRNGLGSNAGEQKCGGIYVSIPVLPPHLVSKSGNCLLSTIFYTKYKKKCGNAAVFKKVLEDMKELSEGLTITVDGKKHIVRFECVLVVGDNLAINSCCGFNESFSANKYCRICSASKKECRIMTRENPAKMRNRENYERDLNKNSPSTTGIKEECCFHKLDKFHITENKSVDVMHDALEGLIETTVSKVLWHFITVNKFFTLKTLNVCISTFDYGKETVKPRQLKTVYKKKKLRLVNKQSAAQMLCLFRYLPIMIAHLIRDKNEHWTLLVMLRKIFDIITSPCYVQADLIALDELIESFLTLYIKLFGDLTPKFHFLLHYVRLAILNGPLVHLWGMMFERKNKDCKDCVTPSKSNVNLPLSIAIRIQLKFCADMHFFKKEQTFYGPLNTSPDYDIKKLVPNIKANVCCYMRVTVKGQLYDKNTILIKSLGDEEPQFAKIVQIYKINNNIYFLCCTINILYYDDDLFAYRVDYISEKPNAFINLRRIPSDVPCILVHKKTSLYVCSKYKI